MEHITLDMLIPFFGGTEIAWREEEHHQLPPYENVPEGRRTPEEGRQAWLDEFFLSDCSPEPTVTLRCFLVKWMAGRVNVLFSEFGIPFSRYIKRLCSRFEGIWMFCHMLVCTLYAIRLKSSIHDLQEVIGYPAFYTET